LGATAVLLFGLIAAAGLRDTARAMSQENVEVVRRYLEAVERVLAAYWQGPHSLEDSLRAGEVRHEIADALRYLHPNIEWKSALIGITTRGYEGMMRGVDQLLDAAQDYRVNVPEVTDLGDSQVLAVLRPAMKGKASDIDVNATIFSIVTVEDGLIIRMDEYLERAEALEAVGLSEQDAHG
jgi:ketosteroid isomerase-like protein